jgi:hypothetical protein
LVSAVLTARDVEAVAAQGRRECAVASGTIITPLARDRAAALGVILSESAATASGDDGGSARFRGQGILQVNGERLALESRIRVVARRALLSRGRSLDGLEDLVAAVRDRLGAVGEGGCGCGGRR